MRVEEHKTTNGKITHVQLDETDNVLPCPFCGSLDIVLVNTHTASYWIECQGCDAQASGKTYGLDTRSEKLTRKQHLMAARSALLKWNTRLA